MTIYEAEIFFREQIEHYQEEGDEEKVKQYENALKSILIAKEEIIFSKYSVY